MTPSVETAASVLRRAAILIRARGWSPFDEGSRLCIYSAVGIVVFGRSAAALTNNELALLDHTIEFVCDAVGNVERIMDWETGTGRTAEDVLGALERAAVAADWELSGDGPPEAA